MFCERIKELRESLQMNQVKFGLEISVSKQCVSNWENGYAVPTITMLCKIAETFSVSTDYLLGLESQSFLNASGLSIEEIVHLQCLIDDLKTKTGV